MRVWAAAIQSGSVGVRVAARRAMAAVKRWVKEWWADAVDARAAVRMKALTRGPWGSSKGRSRTKPASVLPGSVEERVTRAASSELGSLPVSGTGAGRGMGLDLQPEM
jgi:hypothetical protein